MKTDRTVHADAQDDQSLRWEHVRKYILSGYNNLQFCLQFTILQFTFLYKIYTKVDEMKHLYERSMLKSFDCIDVWFITDSLVKIE